MFEMQNITEKIEDAMVKGFVKTTNVVGKLMTKKAGKMLLILPLAMSLLAIPVFAEGGADAEGFINTITELLKKWIPRLGGMIIVVGGIQLGVGFKDDNADGKTRGMQCMIGGAIVTAIGTAINF
jgi:hypothetical protein